MFPEYVPYLFPCVFLNLWGHLGKNLYFYIIFEMFEVFYGICCQFVCYFVSTPCFLSSSTQNYAESPGNYRKKSVVDPKRANGIKTLTSVMSGPTLDSIH